MTNKYQILSAVALAMVVSGDAFASGEGRDSYTSESVQRLIQPSSYSYTQDVVASPDYGHNWFVTVNAGINTFFGKPIGCGDISDKLKPQFGIGFGKWFTPTIGSRLTTWGLQIENAEHAPQNCWGIGSEMMWNLTNSLYDKRCEGRFKLIPYAGMAIINNRATQMSPFAVSYGIIGQYGLTSHLNATVELGCKTTFSGFDGLGQRNRFGGDNILSLSAGLSYTLGGQGFRKVIDSEPVLLDNERLKELCQMLHDNNGRLSRQADKDAHALAELKKIMRIEGLLSRYGHIFRQTSANSVNRKAYPVNDYSGLNSLRARLNGGADVDLDLEEDELGDWIADDNLESIVDAFTGTENATDVIESDKPLADSKSVNQLAKSDLTGYLAEIQLGKRCIGSPIYIFFKLGTTALVDSSQAVNLDEIARVAKSHNLKVKVTGSADSHTGSNAINYTLGNSRADYIAAQLQARGVAASLITKVNTGGSDKLNPTVANRHCKIELSY